MEHILRDSILVDEIPKPKTRNELLIRRVIEKHIQDLDIDRIIDLFDIKTIETHDAFIVDHKDNDKRVFTKFLL